MLAQWVCGLSLLVTLASATWPVPQPPYPPIHPSPFRIPRTSTSPEPSSSSQGSETGGSDGGHPTKVVESFYVRSDIRYRFATTQMSSVVRNVAPKAQEIGFDVTLPKYAFIMAFHMTIDGKRYDGKVKERQQAKREYQAAVDRGQSAGHVRQAPRHANVFQVAVNVAAGSAVNFTLTYQEVLRRQFGVYDHEIHVSPGQPVEDFRIEVNIRENRPLTFVRTPALKTDFLLTNQVSGAGQEGENQLTVVERPSPESARVLFAPSVSQQGDQAGISARFAVQYDVEHAGPRGDVLVVDGYFVHFMAPDGLAHTLPKDIIFVLDVSGSMSGSKIQQVQEAMKTILSDLQPKDRFNIITFSSGTHKWREGLVQADESSIADAQNHVRGMSANGMTNINSALLQALSEMKGRHNKERVGMIFFLTDGHPTEGETDPNSIAANVLKANERTVAIFSLAFGGGADYESLKSLSAQNLGFSRKIYEASDAALQVSSLYDEISAVSIKDMSVKYQNSSVDEFSLTETDFPMVFNGTEILICGLLKEDTESLKYEITGTESQGELDIRAEVDSVDAMVISPVEETDQLFSGPRDFSGMVERMWAYQTIRHLLRQKEKHAGDAGAVKQLEEKVLDMSLKYNFVTPLTSMVVTKPDQKETEVREAKLDSSLSEASMLANRQNSFPVGAGVHQPIMSPRHKSGMPGPAFSFNQNVPMYDPQPYTFFPTHLMAFDLTGMPTMTVTPSMPTATTTPTAPTTTETSTSTTSTTTTSTSTTTTSTRAPQRQTQSSFLRLVTLTMGGAAQTSPLICMVPRLWTYGNIILISGPNNSRLVLTQCSRRQCPDRPSVRSLRFESAGRGRQAVTEVQLDGGRVWRYSSSSAFTVSLLSNSKLLVTGSGLTATLEWTQQGQAAGYRLALTVDPPGSDYSGLLGELSTRPAQLQRLLKKRARNTCRKEGSQFPVLVFNKLARKYSVYRTRKNGKKPSV